MFFFLVPKTVLLEDSLIRPDRNKDRKRGKISRAEPTIKSRSRDNDEYGDEDFDLTEDLPQDGPIRSRDNDEYDEYDELTEDLPQDGPRLNQVKSNFKT